MTYLQPTQPTSAYFRTGFALLLATFYVALALPSAITAQPLKAGAAAVEVTPTQFPVIVNGGFLSRTVDRVDDPLFARCLVLDDGHQRIAIVVVDSCMIPRDICDQAKSLAAARTKIQTDKILISATHTHSAPSVMDFCLGTDKDETYSAQLPGLVAEAIVRAERQLQPAAIGWGTADASAFTKCRRWITRSDQFANDPFGERTVHAMMHPGHQNANYTGPAGPIDPVMTILKVESTDGVPIALFANFSMHYFGGHPGISADYFGMFSREIKQQVARQQTSFVAAMSQGTSGDLWWGDYAKSAAEKPFDSMQSFVDGMTQLAARTWDAISCQSDATVAMAQTELDLGRRTPNPERFAWAERTLKLAGDRSPENRPEVYARQAKYLHENPREKILLQALRIGDLGITALPNEVYALTGLKLKLQSPLPVTMNIELANGASGYIPPPEQHALGGYTTWPARTAGLEIAAEPRIVEATLRLLESVSQRERRAYREQESDFSQFLSTTNPIAIWGLGDLTGPLAQSRTPDTPVSLRFTGCVAFHLPGFRLPPSREDKDTASQNRAVQLAGGKLVAQPFRTGESYSVAVAFQLMTPVNFRATTAVLLQRDSLQLSITGNDSPKPGRLSLGNSEFGATPIVANQWHHLIFVRNGDFVQVFLDEGDAPELTLRVDRHDTPNSRLCIGGDATDAANLEGKLDELVLFDRALSGAEVNGLFRAALGKSNPAAPPVSRESQPLEPAASLGKIHVPAGYHVELVASEPLVKDPVAIDWGPDGRLWVAEMADYPLGMDGRGQPGGRIRWLADSDHDGEFDQSVVFLDQVNFPNGVMAWGKGVLVTAAPEIFYAEDTDGDGKADIRQSLYAGFLEANQQLRVNGLRWGLDGWVYCASGGHYAGFGANTSIFSTKLGRAIPVGSRDFRIRPSSGELEPQAGPSQYGRVRDDYGNWFGVQNSQPLWHYVLRENYLQRTPLPTLTDLRHQVRTPRMPRVYSAKPPQKRFHGFDHPGHYTSACGISIYRDHILFPQTAVAHAFTCEPFHNLVQHHELKDAGTSFDGRRADEGETDFFASEDRWCRPVMSRTGPDGALWVVDMYRYMIEHPEWLPTEGKAELLPDYRQGEQFGRIYRIVPIDHGATQKTVQLETTSTLELVEQLASPNGILRDLAHRFLLQHAQAKSVTAAIRQLAIEHRLPQVGVQSLWLLHQLNELDEATLLTALRSPHTEVRRNAVQLAERPMEASESVTKAVCHLANDPHPRVRLQVACSLGESSAKQSGLALAQLAGRKDLDPFLVAAIISSLPRHTDTMVADLATHDVRYHDQVIQALLSSVTNDRTTMVRLLDGTILSANELPTQRQLDFFAKWLDALEVQGVHFVEYCRRESDALSERELKLRMLLAQATAILFDPMADDSLRATATQLVGRIPETRADERVRLIDLLRSESSTPLSIHAAVIERLRRHYDAAEADALLRIWPQLVRQDRPFVIDLLLLRPDGKTALLEAISAQQVTVNQISLMQRQQLVTAKDPATANLAHEILAAATEPIAPERQAVIARYRVAAQMLGRKEHGQKLFAKHCAACHQTSESQETLGPDLKSLTDRSPEHLLTAILAPSQSVDPQFLNYVVELNDGAILAGLVESESAQGITMALQDGSRRAIAKRQIESMQRTSQSVMPDGFETQLSPQALADVMAFVAEL